MQSLQPGEEFDPVANDNLYGDVGLGCVGCTKVQLRNSKENQKIPEREAMLSADYQHRCLGLLEELSADGSAKQALELLTNHHQQVFTQVEQMLAADDSIVINNQASASRSALHGLPTTISSLSWRNVFRQADNWLASIKQFSAFEEECGLEPIQSSAARLAESIEQFLTSADEYTASFSGKRAWRLLVDAVEARRALSTAISWLATGRAATKAPNPEPNEGTLEFALYGPSNLDGLIRKLDALKGLYSELCRLLEISELEQPLVLLKLETGSLYAKLAGAIPVLSLMDKYLCAGVIFLHRRFTLEGKVESVPRSADTLMALVDLRAQLAEQGISTATLDTEIQRAAAQIGRHLNELLQQQGRVVVNGQIMSVGNKRMIQLLERKEPIFLAPAEANAQDS